MKDLEFIKNKFDTSGVNAPDSLDEQFVLDRTEDKKVSEQKPKKRNYKKYSALAASVAIIALAAFSVNMFRPAKPITDVPIKGESEQAEVRNFKSYEEFKQTLSKIDEREKERQSMLESIGGALYENGAISTDIMSMDNVKTTASSAKTTSHSETYKQVEGVDEADVIKTDGRYIYTVDYDISAVRIFSADGKKSKTVAKIYPKEAQSATPDEAKKIRGNDGETDICDLFIKDDRLVVIGERYYRNSSRVDSKAFVYNVSDIKNIVLLDEFTQTGYYCSSRMIDDKLYLISSYNVGKKSQLPKCGRGASPEKIALDYCYTVENPTSRNLLVVSSFNTADSTYETQSKAILGSADAVYCNENNMYVTAEQWNLQTFEKNLTAVSESSAYSPVGASTQIVKLNLTDNIKIAASAKVRGAVNSQYSLDEYGGNLRVATTSQNSKGKYENNLFILDGSLKKLGFVKGFAKNEHIEAVRYVGDTAYVITYEETDPLFVIDLSDVRKPEILGEAKITGFSTMLVPIDKNTVLGLGYHTEDEDGVDLEVQEGLKLVLFDVSDKKNPKVLDSKIYINCDSEVQYNPKALVYNAERNDFVIPYNYFSDEWDDDYNFIGEQYGGTINFKVENGKIKEIDKYKSHFNYIDRCVYIDDTVYMTNNDGDGALSIDSVKYK